MKGTTSVFAQRQLNHPNEEVVCSLCDRKTILKRSHPTCFGGLICSICESCFERRLSYVKPRKLDTEKAHDKQFANYLKRKAHTEISTRFTFPSKNKLDVPAILTGPVSAKLARAFSED